MPKILVILPTLHGGGAEKIQTLIFGNFPPSYEVEIFLFKNIRDFSTTLPITWALEGHQKLSHPLNLIRTILRLVRRARTADVLYGGFEFYPSFLSVIVGKWLGKKNVVSCHTVLSAYVLHLKGPFRRLLSGLTRFLYPRANQVLAVSRGIAADLTDRFGVPARKITVIHNPIDWARIEAGPTAGRTDSRGTKLLYVGRLTHEKGLDLLLHAVRELHRSGIVLHLTILGDGALRKQYEDLARRLEIGDCCEFRGFVPDPYSHMKTSDVLVVPSRVEGFGNVLIEALAVGLPVVACDCPCGPREILDHGRYGILVPPENPSALARAIGNLISQPDQTRRLREMGKVRARDFELDRIVAEYRRFFDSILANPRSFPI